jgi:hypothetical protein
VFILFQQSFNSQWAAPSTQGGRALLSKQMKIQVVHDSEKRHPQGSDVNGQWAMA